MRKPEVIGKYRTKLYREDDGTHAITYIPPAPEELPCFLLMKRLNMIKRIIMLQMAKDYMECGRVSELELLKQMVKLARFFQIQSNLGRKAVENNGYK